MRTSRAAAIATACVLVAPLLTAAPAAADAVRWSHLDGRDSGKLASGLSSSVAGSNLKRTGDLTPESWWGNDSSWNRYAYVENNPLNMVDPNGEDGWAVAGWVDRQVMSARAYVDANTGSGIGSIALNAAVGSAGDLVSGAADLLRVGASTGDAIGSGASGEDLVVAVSRDAGRAGGLALSLVGAAGSAGLLDDAGRAAGASPKPGSAGGPGAGKRFSQTTRDAARAEAGDGCVFCGTRTTRASGPNQSNIDHAIPKSRGGNNTLANAQNTCRTCNLEKGTQTTHEFLQKTPG